MLFRQARLMQSEAIVEADSTDFNTDGGTEMPYLLGWLLGVPVVVLVILFLLFH